MSRNEICRNRPETSNGPWTIKSVGQKQSVGGEMQTLERKFPRIQDSVLRGEIYHGSSQADLRRRWW